MAEFVQTMKDWRRMCKAIGRDSCDGCKLHADGNDCIAVYEGEMDYAQAEKAITAWATEHPEPVYPTWKEWLEEQRVVVHFDSVDKHGKKVKWELTNKSNCPIPADIAQKLGIESKEG